MLEAIIDLGGEYDSPGFQCEGLVFRADGGIVKAHNPRNQWIPVEAGADGRFEFYLEAAANPVVLGDPAFIETELGQKTTAGPAPLYALRRADLVVVNQEVREIAADITTLRQLADVLARPAAASAHTLSAIGHAHIDSAWLWPLRETRRKAARTIANQLNLLDLHPEHRFAFPAAQHAAWIEEDHPELLYGRAYYRDRFGVSCPEVWLPDSFGYSGALPQLAKLAGAQWFLTQKISWNQVDDFPHHSFWWEGVAAPPARCSPRRRGRPTWRVRRGSGSRRRPSSSPARRPSTSRPASGSASCISRRTAARSPRSRPSRRATAAASTCCARPSCGARPPPSAASWSTRSRASASSGARSACTSSTTSCPAPASPGSTRRCARASRASPTS